jgi:hypothetical protein
MIIVTANLGLLLFPSEVQLRVSRFYDEVDKGASQKRRYNKAATRTEELTAVDFRLPYKDVME